ncbi:MAG TPA: rhodanese-like domain-containing protein, partial [Gammaproteobacteria bacterium]|nr:rhodanese-like domain-containing protein [Gammaproteobacteria bacterium]
HLEVRLHELDKNQAFVVLCRAGKRSLVAIEILKEHGFKNLVNLEGGLYAWKTSVDPDFQLA